MTKQITEMTPEAILDRLNDDFHLIYKPFAKYQLEETELWRMCCTMAEDVELMNRIIFCNDLLRVPPVRVFLALNSDKLENTPLTANEKQFIGCFTAFLFKEVFGYGIQTKVATGNEYIKTACYYSGIQQGIRIVPDSKEGIKPRNSPKSTAT